MTITQFKAQTNRKRLICDHLLTHVICSARNKQHRSLGQCTQATAPLNKCLWFSWYIQREWQTQNTLDCILLYVTHTVTHSNSCTCAHRASWKQIYIYRERENITIIIIFFIFWEELWKMVIGKSIHYYCLKKKEIIIIEQQKENRQLFNNVHYEYYKKYCILVVSIFYNIHLFLSTYFYRLSSAHFSVPSVSHI